MVSIKAETFLRDNHAFAMAMWTKMELEISAINSLAPGSCGCIFDSVIFRLILGIHILRTSREITNDDMQLGCCPAGNMKLLEPL